MKIYALFMIIGLAALSLDCGGQANTNASGNNQNVPAANANANIAAATSTPSLDASTTGSLATPSDAYRTAYALREKRDVTGLKKVLSKDVIEFLTMMAEEEKKSLDDQISEIFVKPQAKTAETRNEKINGDRATLEYLDEKGGWSSMDFVKEGKEWKMSLPDKGDIEIETSPAKKAP